MADGNKHPAIVCYDVGWEHTSLGISTISSAYLLDACLIGSRIVTLRRDIGSIDNGAAE